ncbi:TlpA family protein disulfide reductase [Flavobacteriaceae bacterium PRS1]|nr:TlpA family protein disulfide reductase [Flavobacteriaceae bacterium PRS1]
MQKVSLFLSLIILVSCNSEKPIQKLKPGTYRAVLQVQDNKELPFIFEVETDSTLTIFNAEEKIFVDEIEYRNDSIFIKLPFYEGYIAAIFESGNLKGNFIKESLDLIVPFYTEKNKERFLVTSEPSQNMTGNWEMIFSQNIEEDEYIAKGVFSQDGNKITGTIRTKTGDYRFLEGVMDGNQMKLSAFDGAHAFLFTATVTDSTLQGVFYSGNHFQEPFVAKRNDSFELPNPNTLTFLKKDYDAFAFSFPDVQGDIISLTDERFKNKVVLVQIMGSWCPNCLDESKYYAEFYKNNKDKDFEIVALAFEYAKTKEKAFNSIARMKDRVGIDYPILLAQFGSSNKTKAQEKLPMLNHVLSYPTTIFVDKKGVVRKIHTGFNGPATGDKYVSFQEEFKDFVNQLLKE